MYSAVFYVFSRFGRYPAGFIGNEQFLPMTCGLQRALAAIKQQAQPTSLPLLVSLPRAHPVVRRIHQATL